MLQLHIVPPPAAVTYGGHCSAATRTKSVPGRRSVSKVILFEGRQSRLDRLDSQGPAATIRACGLTYGLRQLCVTRGPAKKAATPGPAGCRPRPPAARPWGRSHPPPRPPPPPPPARPPSPFPLTLPP